jgi:hypothetical protein
MKCGLSLLQAARALSDMGVKKGDRVLIYMPMIPQGEHVHRIFSTRVVSTRGLVLPQGLLYNTPL